MIPLSPNSPWPVHQPETEFIGEVQEFSGNFLPADDPGLEPRMRKGRPADRKIDCFDLPEDEPTP